MNAVVRSGIAASGEPFCINRIDHTGFTVSSLEDSLAFWVDALGFKLLYTSTFERGPFIEEMVGVPGAALRLAMIEGPGTELSCLSILRLISESPTSRGHAMWGPSMWPSMSRTWTRFSHVSQASAGCPSAIHRLSRPASAKDCG